ncbi:MAG: hypothetical protein R3F59_09360 [Myxococcota bacterium]
MVWGWLWASWLGCSSECGQEQCAEYCASLAGAPVLDPVDAPDEPPDLTEISPREQAILDDVLQDVRAGIRPWSAEDAIGVCRGKKGCDKYLGTDAGKLSRGSFFVRAQLLVPPGPSGTWKVRFRSECTRADGHVDTFDREYDAVSAGPGQPTTLQPLRAWDVPSDDGPQVCTWTLVAPDPSGDRTFQGSWETTK